MVKEVMGLRVESGGLRDDGRTWENVNYVLNVGNSQNQKSINLKGM